MSEKSTKKPKQSANSSYDIPTLKNPMKTLWGKIIVVIILAGMVFLPIIGLIFAIINKQ